MSKNFPVPPIVERANLLRFQYEIENHMGIQHKDGKVVAFRPPVSPVQATRIFNAAHDLVFKAIAMASKPENQSMGYTDIALSMVESVRASRLPGSKQVSRELAHELLLNVREIMEACTNEVERDFRAHHILRAAELSQK